MPSSDRKSLRKIATILAGVVILGSLGYFALQLLGNKLNEYLLNAVSFHTTTATVTRKEHVRFDEKNRSYTSDLGDRIEVRPGDEQWRVYYEFDNFDQIGESVRSRVLQHEKKRISEGRPRFSFKDKEWYDSIKVGDKINVTYRPFSSGEIEIRGVTKAEP